MAFHNLYVRLATEHIFPEFFYSLGKSKTDIHFLKKQLSQLSREKRIEVCEMYSSWFRSLGREKANQKLIEFVSEHAEKGSEPEKVDFQPNEQQKRIFERLGNLQKIAKTPKQRYRQIFDD